MNRLPFLPEEREAVERICGVPGQWGGPNVSRQNAGGAVTELDLRGLFEPDDFRAIAALKHVCVISTDAQKPLADDYLLEACGQLPRLQRLSIFNGERITDAGVAHLGGHPTLLEIQIQKASITDGALKPLGTIDELRTLQIGGAPQLTNASLEALTGLRHLGNLILGNTVIDDEGLRFVAQMTKLVGIHILGSQIRGPGVRHLQKMKTLMFLVLKKCAVTDETVASITGLKKLEHLSLDGSSFGDAGLAAFATALPGLPKLSNLSLQNTHVSGHGIGVLSGASKLKQLFLIGCPLDKGAIPELGMLTQVKHIVLTQTPFASKEGDALKKLLPKCSISVDGKTDDASDDDDDEEGAPWNDPQYFQKHPPACLQGLKLTKGKGDPLPEDGVRFQLACKCGHKKCELLGHPISQAVDPPQGPKPGEIFVSPLSFRCGKCQATAGIIDTDEHGYNGQTGSSACIRGEGEQTVCACPECNGTLWTLQAAVIHDDGARDIWFDNPEIPLEDYFGAFWLTGTCAKCKKERVLAEFETA